MDVAALSAEVASPPPSPKQAPSGACQYFTLSPRTSLDGNARRCSDSDSDCENADINVDDHGRDAKGGDAGKATPPKPSKATRGLRQPTPTKIIRSDAEHGSPMATRMAMLELRTPLRTPTRPHAPSSEDLEQNAAEKGRASLKEQMRRSQASWQLALAATRDTSNTPGRCRGSSTPTVPQEFCFAHARPPMTPRDGEQSASARPLRSPHVLPGGGRRTSTPECGRPGGSQVVSGIEICVQPFKAKLPASECPESERPPPEGDRTPPPSPAVKPPKAPGGLSSGRSSGLFSPVVRSSITPIHRRASTNEELSVGSRSSTASRPSSGARRVGASPGAFGSSTGRHCLQGVY